MIIEVLFEFFYNYLDKYCLALFDIPEMPVEISNSVSEFLGYFYYARGFVNLVFPIDLTPYFLVFFSIFAFRHGYPIIMWIIRKIPFLGME